MASSPASRKKLTPKWPPRDLAANRTFHLATLLIVSGLVACWLHAIYLPWWCGDSPGYAGPAWRIYHGAFAGYTGIRTPGYPLFLLACECFGGVDNRTMTPLSGEIVTWVQSLLHIANAPLLYITMERLRIRPWLAFALALLFACSSTSPSIRCSSFPRPFAASSLSSPPASPPSPSTALGANSPSGPFPLSPDWPSVPPSSHGPTSSSSGCSSPPRSPRWPAGTGCDGARSTSPPPSTKSHAPASPAVRSS